VTAAEWLAKQRMRTTLKNAANGIAVYAQDRMGTLVLHEIALRRWFPRVRVQGLFRYACPGRAELLLVIRAGRLSRQRWWQADRGPQM